MATLKQKKAAEAVYNTIIKYLDGADLKYEIKEAPGDDYMISLNMKGDDLPVHMYIIVDADREIIMLKSLEFTTFGMDQIDLAAKAVCFLNDTIADGSYALNIEDGHIMWTATTCFRGSLIGEDTIRYLIGISVTTLDAFNDKLMMLKMGILDLESFCEKIRNR